MAGIDSSRFAQLRPKPAPPPSYADDAYWFARYTDTNFEPYDWYLKLDQLKDTLSPLISPLSQIVILGCGTSDVAERMFHEGFQNITCIDRCEVLIDHFADKHQDRTTLQFEATPVHLIPKDYPSWVGKFDLALDKGMLDAIACCTNKEKDTSEALMAISQILKPKSGIYVCVSHASPELREQMFFGAGGNSANLCGTGGSARSRASSPGADAGARSARSTSARAELEADDPKMNESQLVGVSRAYSWRVCHKTLPRPMNPHVEDPKGKAAPAKGAASVDLTPSPAFMAEEHVYHVYTCHRFDIGETRSSSRSRT
eukprot:TRINITY_DN49204_c0_g1_i1.p1 TRINITY_DN49204_c0_g1~~TRINITY_DN49204_c0_g1_i1.p1  ORF type:complete len:315 (+),score=23.55 TRINITY_DN49204_c0_g1_i1:36-980(+)